MLIVKSDEATMNHSHANGCLGRALLSYTAAACLIATARAADHRLLTVNFDVSGQYCLDDVQAASVRNALSGALPADGALTLYAYSDASDFVDHGWRGDTSCVGVELPAGVVDHERLSVLRAYAVLHAAGFEGSAALSLTPTIEKPEAHAQGPARPGSVTVVPVRSALTGPRERRVEVWLETPELVAPGPPQAAPPSVLVDTAEVARAIELQTATAWMTAQDLREEATWQRGRLTTGLVVAGAACIAGAGWQAWEGEFNSFFPGDSAGHSAAAGTLLAVGLTDLAVGLALRWRGGARHTYEADDERPSAETKVQP